MKHSHLVAGAVLILILGAAAGLVFSNKPTQADPKLMETDVKLDSTDEMGTLQPTPTGMVGALSEPRYVEFSPAALSNSATNRRVLFFYANWCPTCIPADKKFQENLSQIPADVTIIRVNYNDNETDQIEKDLAKRYGVTYQHTYVQIDGEGNQVTKWNGGDLDQLLTRIK